MPAIRRIVVGVHGSLGSLQALRHAADEARIRAVPIVPVIAWVPPGGDHAERRHPSPYLRRIAQDMAWQRLWAAFDAGLGGVPADIGVEPRAIRSAAGPVLVGFADRTGDLLIIGTGRRPAIWTFRRSVGRYCLRFATSPVLAVPPTRLITEIGHERHPFRHPCIPLKPPP